MNIEGKLVNVSEIEFVGQNGTAKRTIRIETLGNYPSLAEFTLIGDKTRLADNLTPNQRVDIHFNINGRTYNKKDGSGEAFFQDLAAYRINVVSSQSAAFANAPTPSANTPTGGQVAAPVTGGIPVEAMSEDELDFLNK